VAIIPSISVAFVQFDHLSAAVGLSVLMVIARLIWIDYAEMRVLGQAGKRQPAPRTFCRHRARITEIIEPYKGGEGFCGRAPGGPSRWNGGEAMEWMPLKPKFVVEVAYDHFTAERFRHGTKILRWRPDKKSKQCTMDQVETGKGPSVP
jgi:hypothetical protein